MANGFSVSIFFLFLSFFLSLSVFLRLLSAAVRLRIVCSIHGGEVHHIYCKCKPCVSILIRNTIRYVCFIHTYHTLYAKHKYMRWQINKTKHTVLFRTSNWANWMRILRMEEREKEREKAKHTHERRIDTHNAKEQQWGDTDQTKFMGILLILRSGNNNRENQRAREK